MSVKALEGLLCYRVLLLLLLLLLLTLYFWFYVLKLSRMVSFVSSGIRVHLLACIVIYVLFYFY